MVGVGTSRQRRPFPLGRRGRTILAIVAAGLVAWFALGLSPAQLVPTGGAGIARDFFAAAWRPALDYEGAGVPDGARPFLLKVLDATVRTIVFATAAMSLALPIGLVLGFLASSVGWSGDPATRASRLSRTLARSVQGATRTLIIGMRSVHELLWAVLFLVAFGLNTASAVLAIAIPYTGTLAKVFSEMLDEAPRDSAAGLRATGAAPVQVFLHGILPRALPDMTAYAFYRYECAIRSSAILGFFGYPTLGYYLRASFENLHYREVWTYLYALLILALVLESWSTRLRQRFVA